MAKFTKEVTICDNCNRECCTVVKCVICHAEYCSICEGVFPGCVANPQICDGCSSRADVIEIIEKWAVQTRDLLRLRDVELHGIANRA